MAEQMAVLQQLLLATLDPRPSVRQAAEQQLTAARQTDLGQFVGSMAALIALEQPPPGPAGVPGSPEDLIVAKQIAAVTFKNSISAKNISLDGAAAEAWRALPVQTKTEIKKQLLAALQTDCTQVGNAVCQVLAKLGVIELRFLEFEDLLPALQEMVQQAVSCQQQQQLAKACGRHALTCLAYLCEELADIISEGEEPADVLSQQRCNVVLTAVVHGLKDSDPQLKVAALRALYHALIFAKENFNRKEERDYIFAAVVEAGGSANPSAVQVAAFECLVQIAQEYYSILEAYMPAVGPISASSTIPFHPKVCWVLAQLTWNALKGSDPAVVIAALEVWNALAEEERAIIDGETTRWNLLKIMEQAAPFLLPLLLEQLLNAAEDEDDDDSWTPAMAAAICLGLCAQVVQDAILPPVLEFVQLNFGSAEWRRREASLLALGCVMEGPSAEAMAPYVATSFPLLVKAVASDVSVAVRDSAAWTLGKAAQQHAPIVLRHLFSPTAASPGAANAASEELLLAIVERLADQPRVAVHICWMLHELADNINTPKGREAYLGAAAAVEPTDRNPLDPIFPKLCEALLRVSERPDADEKNLREAAFSCMGALIKNSGSACWNHLLSLLEHFEGQLRKSFDFEQTEQTKQRQGMLCGVIQILCLRLGDGVKPVASNLWGTLKRVFQQRAAGAPVAAEGGAPGNPHGFIVSSEPSVCDALLATSALINASGSAISPFVGELAELLLLQMRHQHEPQAAAAAPLTNSAENESTNTPDELQAARISIELVGDLSRALEADFNAIADPLLHQFYELLKAPSVDRSLKPVVIVAVGDVALSLGGEHFARFAPWLIELLVQAGVTPYDAGPPNWQLNEEWMWYVHELRSATLEALVSCVYALKKAKQQEMLRKEVNGMLEVVKAVAESPSWLHGLPQMVQQALELTGALLLTFGSNLGSHLRTASFIVQLQREAQRLATEEDNSEVATKAEWVSQLLARKG